MTVKSSSGRQAAQKNVSTGKKRSDPRVQRTRDALRRAFIDLICEMNYEDITVKELTDRAHVNRKTFYLHYTSMDELLSELQNEMNDDFSRRTQGLRPPRDMDRITREFFLSMEQAGRFGERLACSGNYSAINRRMVNRTMQRSWRGENNKGADPHVQNILMAFTAGATLAVYRQWVADGKKISLENIIRMTGTLVCDGLNAWISAAGPDKS
jgi:AcrR family transcriptional regulator